MSDHAVLEVESDKGFAGRDDPDNLLGMVAWMSAHSGLADPPEPPDLEEDDWGEPDADTPTPVSGMPSRRSMIAEAVFNPDLHPRDRTGKWRHNAFAHALSPGEWAAHGEHVEGPLYHYTDAPPGGLTLHRGTTNWGHGGVPMLRFPHWTPSDERIVEVHGNFHVFNVKDGTGNSDAIWRGLGADDAFNRLIKETAAERGLPTTPGLGWSYEKDGPLPRYLRGLTARVAEKLRTQGYDGISLGGEVVLWNYDKMDVRDDFRDADSNRVPVLPHGSPGPNTVLNHQLSDRLEAAGVHGASGLEQVPQKVVDDSIAAIQHVRSQIKPTPASPDPMHIDLLEARSVDDGAVMSTYFDPEGVKGTTVEFNLHEPDQLWNVASEAAALDFVGWASRDPYGRAQHELGHVYHRNQIGVDVQPILVALSDAKMIKDVGDGEYDFTEPPGAGRTPGWPSIYAQSSPAEAFAEMFSLMMRPEALDNYPDHELLDEHLRLFRESWNRQMKAKGLPTIPEVIPS